MIDPTYIWLPRKFWQDHHDRDLPSGELLVTAGSRVLVRVTPDELDEIRSDADFYSEPTGFEPGYGVLQLSARRTVAAIDRHRTKAVTARTTT